MPAGPDVWGCSYEGLREYVNRMPELEELLKDTIENSYRHSIQQYR